MLFFVLGLAMFLLMTGVMSEKIPAQQAGKIGLGILFVSMLLATSVPVKADLFEFVHALAQIAKIFASAAIGIAAGYLANHCLEQGRDLAR